MNTTDTPAASIHPDPALALLMHRLDVADGKLSLATAHWTGPGKVATEDLGAVAIIREVASEITDLYCALTTWAHEHELLVRGPLVDSFQAAQTDGEGDTP